MSTGLTAFTTTHGVIHRVHNNTAVVRTTTEPTRATGLTRLLEGVVRVAYATDGSLTSREDQASLT